MWYGECLIKYKQEGDKDSVLVMLNGENEGLLMRWRPGCALTLAQAAAIALRGDSDGEVSENLYLYDQMGLVSPMSVARGIRKLNFLQLPYQEW